MMRCLIILGYSIGLALTTPIVSAHETGWDLTKFETSSSLEFRQFVFPLAQAMRLTYTSTQGSSYFNPLDVNASIPGFTRSSLVHDPPGGMRALVFSDVDGRRVLLAFRGTDLDNRTASGMADACAGRILFRGARREDLPASCDSFSDTTLDYSRAAITFAEIVQIAYPGFDLLVTGHSLGTGLALLVAAALSTPGQIVQVVALAMPPLHKHPGKLLPTRSAYFLADSNDPVQRAANAAGIFETECLWDTGATPAVCIHCKYSSNGDVRSNECLDCIAETHSLKHYLGLLRGSRPLCAGAAQGAAASQRPNTVPVVDVVDVARHNVVNDCGAQSHSDAQCQ